MTQQTALSILKTGASVFLTGEPGSGKSHTISVFIDFLRSHGVDPVVTASTGIAATHIGGMTIHSWSGIGIRDYLSEYDLEFLAQKEYLVKRITNATTVIIDEISMIDARTLDMIDSVMRYIRRNNSPFGGVQMIFVGDYFQLPPIIKEREFEGPTFSFQSKAWQELDPIICYLHEQHRQGDTEFIDLLSAIRRSTLQSHHHALLNERMTADDLTHIPATQLYTHNIRVNDVNMKKLEGISGEIKIFSMSGSGSKTMVESLQRNCLSPVELALKPGARVMFTKNIPQLGVMNGTLGTIIEYSRTSGFPVVELVNGAKISVEPVEWAIEVDGKVKARVSQVPLRLAWAITVHKSQGMSLDAAVIDLSNAFEYGQGYVALSRVRSLSGVYLLGINERALQTHPEILSFDDSLKEKSEEAEELYESISEANLNEMAKKYIEASGGDWDTKKALVKKVKKDTFTQTFELVEEGKGIDEIVDIRGLKKTTILDHIERLVTQGKLTKKHFDSLFQGEDNRIPVPVLKVMDSLGTEKLAPLFSALKGKYSYDDLKVYKVLYIGKNLK